MRANCTIASSTSQPTIALRKTPPPPLKHIAGSGLSHVQYSQKTAKRSKKERPKNGDVVGCTVYKNDTVTHRIRGHRGSCDINEIAVTTDDPSWPEHAKPLNVTDVSAVEDEDKGKVKEFSYRSRQHLRFVAQNSDAEWQSMITLTYPTHYPKDGRIVKEHKRRFDAAMKYKLGEYLELWWFEFQQRGAPHYHIVLDIDMAKHGKLLKRSNRKAKYCQELQDFASDKWASIISKPLSIKVSGELVEWQPVEGTKEDSQKAGVSWEQLYSKKGGTNYVTKYAMKMRQKVVPPNFTNVGRFWGCSKAAKPKPKAEYICTEHHLKEILAASPLHRAVAKNLENGYLPKVVFGAGKAVREYEAQLQQDLEYKLGVLGLQIGDINALKVEHPVFSPADYYAMAGDKAYHHIHYGNRKPFYRNIGSGLDIKKVALVDIKDMMVASGWMAAGDELTPNWQHAYMVATEPKERELLELERLQWQYASEFE